MEWNLRLKRMNQALWRLPDADSLEVPQDSWLGNEAATQAEIESSEQRLNVNLPHSLRQFYFTSNGWNWCGPDYLFPQSIFSLSRLVWLRDVRPELIEAYYDPGLVSEADHLVYGKEQDVVLFRSEYLEHCLLIGEESEGGCYLLCPKVMHDGEWEAWHFANYHPGALRFRSFTDLIEDTIVRYGELDSD